MPYSHHSHSGQFCKHAESTLEDIVAEAIRQGFRVFGLSEHVPRYRTSDLYPEEVRRTGCLHCVGFTDSQNGLTPEDLMRQFEGYIEEAHRLKQAYRDEITLLVGLETEYITPLDLDNLEKLLERFGEKIEYIVGSVHHVGGTPIDFDLATFQSCVGTFEGESERARMEGFLCAYFDAQQEVLERFRPEVVGHIDLCRLYNPHLLFSDYPRAKGKLERNIRFAAGYGAIFEASAAPFRKGWDTAYPGKDVLEVGHRSPLSTRRPLTIGQAIVELGGRLGLSDDSHGKQAVGLNYGRLAAYLNVSGIARIYYLADGGTGVGARRAKPVAVDGDWSSDPFWARLSRRGTRSTSPRRPALSLPSQC